MAFDKDRFLDVLASRGDWVDARFIADTFGVTTRTVRNYVKKLNDESDGELVESSYRGYRLRQDVVRERPRTESPQPEDRADDRTVCDRADNDRDRHKRDGEQADLQIPNGRKSQNDLKGDQHTRDRQEHNIFFIHDSILRKIIIIDLAQPV